MLDVNDSNYNRGGMAETVLSGLMVSREKAHRVGAVFLYLFIFSFAQVKWLATKMNDCFLCKLLGSRVDLIELN